MLDHAQKGRCIQASSRRYLAAEGRIVARRRGAMEPQHAAKDHHHRAQAASEHLELPRRLAAGRQHALPEVKPLAHPFELDLEAKIALFVLESSHMQTASQHP